MSRLFSRVLFSMMLPALLVFALLHPQPALADRAKLDATVYSGTLDVASLNDAAGSTSTLAVVGAKMGDWCLASMGVDVSGISVTCYVSAAGTVSVRFQNESGGTVDLASTTLRVVLIHANLF